MHMGHCRGAVVGDALARLLDMRLGYSEAPGSLELRSLLAGTYANTGPDNILVTTGAIEATKRLRAAEADFRRALAPFELSHLPIEVQRCTDYHPKVPGSVGLEPS